MAPRRTAALLLLGLILPQCALFAPSLRGTKLFLPLDVLRQTGVYLPPVAGRVYESPDWLLSDTVLETEIDRTYMAAEWRAGRVPLWNPYNYGGGPFMANQPETISPFVLFHVLWPSPTRLAWFHLLCSLFAGLGMFGFLRRACRLHPGPALLGAWILPWCGGLVLWAGFPLHTTMMVLPWMLWATHSTLRSPKAGSATVGLGIATFLALTGGDPTEAGYILIGSALWALVELARGGSDWRRIWRLPTAWALGLLLAAPVYAQGIPYLLQSRRLVERLATSQTPYPPAGWDSLAQLCVPLRHGSLVAGSGLLLSAQGLLNESTAQGYCGAFLLLALAPMGLLYARERRLAWAFLALAVFGVAWQADLPGVQELFRIPPLVLVRGNRSPILTVIGLLGLAALGLDGWRRGAAASRVAPAGPLAFGGLATLVAGCLLWRGFVPDPRVAEAGPRAVAWFRHVYLAGFAWSACAAGWWAVVAWQARRDRRHSAAGAGAQGWCAPRAWLAALVLLTALVEVVLGARGLNPQSDPSLYYPRLAALDRLRALPWGRVAGMSCFPPNLLRVYRLPDIRGYDAADPMATIRLLRAACPGWKEEPEYAVTQWLVPRPTPAIDMLGVRYLVYLGPAPDRPPSGLRILVKDENLWVAENPRALPRAFLPQAVTAVADNAAALRAIASPQFDPATTAYVEGPPAGAPLGDRGEGAIRVTKDEPGSVRAEVRTRAPCLAVLNEVWYPGWRARVDGKPAPTLRVNGGLVGVAVAAGAQAIEWRYRPAGWYAGLALAGMALAILAAMGWAWRKPRDGEHASLTASEPGLAERETTARGDGGRPRSRTRRRAVPARR